MAAATRRFDSALYPRNASRIRRGPRAICDGRILPCRSAVRAVISRTTFRRRLFFRNVVRSLPRRRRREGRQHESWSYFGGAVPSLSSSRRKRGLCFRRHAIFDGATTRFTRP